MSNHSLIYHELCNSGNALNRVIYESQGSKEINDRASNIRESIAELIELVTLEAEHEQAECLALCVSV